MSQNNAIRRQYNMGNANMLSYAYVMHLDFSIDLADFKAFNLGSNVTTGQSH